MPSDDEFELVDPAEIDRHIVIEKEPDLDKIRLWLRPTDYNATSSEFKRHLSSQAPGTGEWIRETDQFKQWHSSSTHGSIWIKAVPGAGKSVVAASMVDSLAHHEQVPVLFHFYRHIVHTNRTARSLIRDWMAQLLPYSYTLQATLWELVEAKTDLESISSDQLWKHVLTGMRSLKRVYCVVDALDEMTPDSDFLSKLNSLSSSKPANVKLLLTSRPKQYLQRALQNPEVIHVQLEEELVKRDIATFVAQKVDGLGLASTTQETQRFLRTTVCERSKGLFLYARLMLDQIFKSVAEGGMTETKLCHMVSNLPVGLTEMYNTMLQACAMLTGITEDVQLIVLQLVTHSTRPLRLLELAKALEASGALSSTTNSKDVVRTACGPLLEIMEDEVVQIIHHSFTEFLLEDERIYDRGYQFPVIDPSTSHHQICLLCLKYLQNGCLEDSWKENKNKEGKKKYYGRRSMRDRTDIDLDALRLHYPFVDYATRYWPYHARTSQRCNEVFFKDLDDFCSPGRAHYNAWVEVVSSNSYVRVAFEGTTPLHVAAATGLEGWAQHLLASGADIDARDKCENSPLFYAAREGYTGLARMLIESGCEPDIDGYDGLKPAHTAASRNHFQIIKLLVAAGVSPLTRKTREVGRRCGNAPSSVGQTPLQYASQAGHVETVTEMMSSLDEKSLSDSLCWAAKGGHTKLVSALLEKTTVSPDSTAPIKQHLNYSEGGESAIQLAAQALVPDCVRVLLQHGANPSAASVLAMGRRSYKSFPQQIVAPKLQRHTALHGLATHYDLELETASEEVLNVLVAAGADLEAVDGQGNTPLLSAIDARNGNSRCVAVESFLKAGSNPHAVDDDGENLIVKISRTSYDIEFLGMLLDKGIDPKKTRISDGYTALHVAMSKYSCSSDGLQQLVDSGVSINVKDKEGNTPLHIHYKRSPSGSKGEVADALLKLGADVNSQNFLGQTCLHLFRYNSYDQRRDSIVPKLLDAGFDLERRDRSGFTPLLQAISNQSQEFVEVLLRAGASPSARTHSGDTSLHLACRCSSPRVMIETLLKYGADPCWTDSQGNTLLHEVSKNFSGCSTTRSLIRHFVSLGVSATALNFRHQTVLHIAAMHHHLSASRSVHPDESYTREGLASFLHSIGHPVDINAQDVEGYAAIHYASAHSEAGFYNVIKAGANVNVKSYELRTALHCAARARQVNNLAMLLTLQDKSNYTLDLNAKDQWGNTPLQDACRSGRPESCRLLIDAGATIEDSALVACAEFVLENQKWAALYAADKALGTPAYDVFRPPDHRSTWSSPYPYLSETSPEPKTVRSGVIAEMLLDHGADSTNAFSKALQIGDGDVLNTLYSHPSSSSGHVQNPTRRQGFKERVLMRPFQNFDHVIDRKEECGPLDDPGRHIQDINLPMFKFLLKNGMRTDRISDWNAEATFVGKLARLGLSEYLTLLTTEVTRFDDPAYTAKLVEGSSSCSTASSIRPILHFACDRSLRNMDVVRLLVNAGVDVNAYHYVFERSKHDAPKNRVPGSTVLHRLAEGSHYWHVEAIEYLIAQGANVDALDAQKQTPLKIACCQSNIKDNGFFKPNIVEVLLRNGADPNRIDNQGQVPLNYVRSDPETIETLLRYGARIDAGKKNVLMSAAEAEEVETIDLCLRNGASCDAPDMSEDPLYRCHSFPTYITRKYALLAAAFPCKSYHRNWVKAGEMVETMLRYKPNVYLPIGEKDTLIHYVFEHGVHRVLEKFLDREGFDFNARDQRGRTVFMAACNNSMSWEDTGRVFDVEEKRKMCENYVPAYLQLANAKEYGKQIDYLATDGAGRHLLFYLAKMWNDKISHRFLAIDGVKNLMTQKDNAGFSPLHYALKINRVDACWDFIEQGEADLVEPDPDGNTVLHHMTPWVYKRSTSERDALALCKLYLERGGCIDAKNKYGQAALLTSLSIWNFQFFIDNGADVRIQNDGKETVLHVLAQHSNDGGAIGIHRRYGRVTGKQRMARLFRKLVELGCDALTEDASGRTALDVAAASGRTEILQLYERKKSGSEDIGEPDESSNDDSLC